MIAYRRPIDALASVLPLEVFHIYPCSVERKINGQTFLEGIPADQCYKMQPPRRFRGIWLDEFEGSTFFEGFHDAGRVDAEIRREIGAPDISREWLGWNENQHNPVLRSSNNKSRLVALDFIGRRTAYRGRYGHMGMSDNQIIVDRVISARPVYQASTPFIEDELREK